MNALSIYTRMTTGSQIVFVFQSAKCYPYGDMNDKVDERKKNDTDQNNDNDLLYFGREPIGSFDKIPKKMGTDKIPC
jgi:hypothetical protein